MTDDIVDRLRRMTPWEPGRHIVPQLEERMDEAADEIVRLRERVTELKREVTETDAENDELIAVLKAERQKWVDHMLYLGVLPEEPLSNVHGCTCQRFDPETKVCTYGNAPCRYHELAAQQPWNHRIPWNCPTYYDGCNCPDGPYFPPALAAYDRARNPETP